MNNIIPFFEVNGKRYEIKRNHILLAELDKMKRNSPLDEKDEQNYGLLISKYQRLSKLQQRVEELEDKYHETFEQSDKEIYDRASAAYDELFKEVTQFEIETKGVLQKVKKIAIDNGEKLIIFALQYNEKGETIRTEQEANDLWCAYVDEVGTSVASEWVEEFISYIAGDTEAEDNSFLAQRRKAAEERAANRKNGMAKKR